MYGRWSDHVDALQVDCSLPWMLERSADAGSFIVRRAAALPSGPSAILEQVYGDEDRGARGSLDVSVDTR